MKAIIFEEHGGVEKLKYKEVPVPQLASGEVLVRVKACALNHLDIWTRQGLPGVTIPLPHILGCDIAGVVEKLGANTSGRFKKGDRVVVSPGQSCGQCEVCYKGFDSFCLNYKIMGFQVDGGYAQFAKAPEQHLIAVSDKLSFEEWAAAPLVFLTAWHMLITRAQLKPGETVLIHAAGSGIGSAAIQIAKLVGARVLTTAGSKEKLQQAKKLGADMALNYKEEDFHKAAQKENNGEGVDVVFEHIGPEVWEKSLASLRRGGRLVTCGATSGPKAEINLRALFMKQLQLLGSYMGSRHELNSVLALIEQGKLRPVVDSTFPLKEAALAQQRMLDRKNFGKIVLVP